MKRSLLRPIGRFDDDDEWDVEDEPAEFDEDEMGDDPEEEDEEDELERDRRYQ